MDDYREKVKKVGATPIGSIFSDFASEGGPQQFADGQQILVAGIIGNVKTRTTKNNSMMAYADLEDDSGSMELIVFQRALDDGGAYLKNNTAVLVRGRISVRDEKEPQIMVDTVRPISDLNSVAAPQQESAPGKNAEPEGKKLYLKLDSREEKTLRKIELLLEMFPGNDTMVQYFADIRKQRTARCVLHNSLLRELKEILGEDNVVIK